MFYGILGPTSSSSEGTDVVNSSSSEGSVVVTSFSSKGSDDSVLAELVVDHTKYS